MRNVATFILFASLVACGGSGDGTATGGQGGDSGAGSSTGADGGGHHGATSGSHMSSASTATSTASTSTSTSSSGGAGQGGGGAGGGGPAPCPGAKPDATNTGVPAGVTLTVVDHDVEITDDNTVLDAQDIHGFLTISASHVRVTRSIIRGYATAATTAIVRVKSGTDFVIEDSEIAAAEPSVDVDGVSGSNFTARRLNIHGGVDGMKLGSNTVVECSFIHDMAHFDSDPNQNGGPTHNDAIQILAGTGIRIVGSTLLAATSNNAAIQVTQDFGPVGDLHIESNWADGGGCTFNFSHKGGDSLTDLHTLDNRFGRASFFDCPILKSTKTTLDSMGDVWDDDGTPVPVQTHD